MGAAATSAGVLAAALLLSAPRVAAQARSHVDVRSQTYCVVNGRSEQMTVFEPANAQRPAPAVLQIHGGAWERGHRVDSLRQSTAVDIGSLGVARLVADGFVVASASYQLAGSAKWPVPMQDVACALRSLRAHAQALGIDPSRVGVLGSSAGGHLASLLATDPSDPRWSRGPYSRFSARPDALVDEFGPVNLATPDWSPFMQRVIARVFGAAPVRGSSVLERASPLDHITAGDPPTLILQGTADNTVRPSQSEAFAARLRAAKVPVALVLVKGGPHGLRVLNESPSPATLSATVERFLATALG